MIEGAADLGYKRAIVPAANESDILLEHRYRKAVEIVLVHDVAEMLDAAVPRKMKNREATLENLLRRPVVKARKA
jgi:predicted ATP-dependent protease